MQKCIPFRRFTIIDEYSVYIFAVLNEFRSQHEFEYIGGDRESASVESLHWIGWKITPQYIYDMKKKEKKNQIYDTTSHTFSSIETI